MDIHNTLAPQATAASPTGVTLTPSTQILSTNVDRNPSLQASLDILAEGIQGLSQSLPKPKPPIVTWVDVLLPIIQALTIFGGSITFTLIIGANAQPTRRFTDQMVRDMLCVAWLLAALALAMATIAQLTVAGRDERIQARGGAKLVETHRWKFMSMFLPFCLGGCTLGSFFLLSLVMLAYSDVGWLVIIIVILGSVACLAGWFAYTFMPKSLDRLLGL